MKTNASELADKLRGSHAKALARTVDYVQRVSQQYASSAITPHFPKQGKTLFLVRMVRLSILVLF
ncbi:MAG: hypothetical protein ACI8Y7_001091 [Candidatus Woesearchaeota archaeon]|jgi:hypothetical protein